jgi:hypothetical protein
MINNEAYLISFETGTCGVFIKTILEQILAQDHIAYQRVLKFPNGHAHDVSSFTRLWLIKLVIMHLLLSQITISQ